jgi:hypothetical protein
MAAGLLKGRPHCETPPALLFYNGRSGWKADIGAALSFDLFQELPKGRDAFVRRWQLDSRCTPPNVL